MTAVSSTLQGASGELPSALEDEVVSAIAALHGPRSSPAERSAANGFLCHWQESVAAWYLSDRLLQTRTHTAEVHHLAAATLRSKIMYDFMELPNDSLESLCHSLLQHINTFKTASPSSIYRLLVYALADLSVHTAYTWTSPVVTIIGHYSTLQDTETLVDCLCALPEENSNRSVMVDSVVRSAHTQLLTTKADDVILRLEEIKKYAVESKHAETYSKVLRCYVAWLPFASSYPTDAVPGSILQSSFDLLHLDTLQAIANTSTDPNHTSSGAVAVACGDTTVQSTTAGTSLFASAAGGRELAMELSYAAITCLCEILRHCRRRRTGSVALFEYALTELSGPIKDFALAAVEQKDWGRVLALVRLYEYVCAGLKSPIVERLYDNEKLQQLIQVVFVFTEVPFAPVVCELGEHGIASQSFNIWYDFIAAFDFYQTRDPSAQQTKATADDQQHAVTDFSDDEESPVFDSGPHHPSTAPAQAHSAALRAVSSTGTDNTAVACSINVTERLVVVLLNACQWPADLLADAAKHPNDTDDDVREFLEFRRSATWLLYETQCVLTIHGLFDRLFQSLSSCSHNPSSIAAQEAHLVAINAVLGEASVKVGIRPELEGIMDFLVSFLEKFPPRDILNASARTAVVTILGRCAHHGWLHCRLGSLRDILERLILQTRWNPALISAADKEASGVTFQHRTRALAHAAADATTALCRALADCPELQALVDDLISAAHLEFRDVQAEIHCSILEAVGRVVSKLNDDNVFLKSVDALCTPILQSIAVSSAAAVNSTDHPNHHHPSTHYKLGDSTSQGLLVGTTTSSSSSIDTASTTAASTISATTASGSRTGSAAVINTCNKLIDRLAVIIKSICPINSPTRRKSFGNFAVGTLWPMVESLMLTHRDSNSLIECCDRVLKHAMRCSPEEFLSVLPALSTVLINNSQYRVYSSYLYAVDWLAVEYSGAPEAQPYLASLFSELTSLGIKAAVQSYALNADASDNHDILEDLFNMLSRFTRFCTTIAATSPHIDAALELACRVIYHEHDGVCAAVMGFIKIISTIAAGHGDEVVKFPKRDEVAIASAVATHLEPLFLNHLPKLFAEFMRLLLTVPRYQHIFVLRWCIESIVCAWPPNIMKPIVDEALQVLPSRVVPSTAMRAALLDSIVAGNKHQLYEAIDDIAYRSKQVLFRHNKQKASGGG
eukprot:Lankesteria_metandrocarpae@DN4799_c0_g1_i1.p1